MNSPTRAFWSTPVAEMLTLLGTTANGLSAAKADAARERWGANRLAPGRRTGAVTILWRQFSSPIVLILLGATVISFFLGDGTDALIIVTIVLANGLLGF
jgi:P-type Mg2+ transporter